MNSTNSAACLLFHAFLNRLLVAVFAENLALAGIGVDDHHSIRGLLHMLDPASPAVDRSFCSFSCPPGLAECTCDDQVQAALTGAYTALTQELGADTSNWRWGRLHSMSPKSEAFPLVAAPYNPGPYARPGGALTVDVGKPSLNTNNQLTFGYGAGSNVRFIAVADGSVTKEQLPGPIRDGPFFPGSPGLLGDYVQNKYFDFPYGSSAISAATVSTQTFSP